MSHHHVAQLETHGAGSTEHAPQVAVRDGNRLLCPCCGEVLMHLAVEEPCEEPSPTPEPAYPKPPGMRPSPWEAIARRQDALKEAAWEAFQQAERAKQEARHAQFLASDDPGFCADYLTVPIDPHVAAYDFPEEDPPQLPSPKRTKQNRDEDSPTRRKRPKRWKDLPLEQPYTYQEKRYLAWSFYRLKLQDLELQEKIHTKQTKIECLRRELGASHEVPEYEPYLPSEDVPKVCPHVEVVEFDLLYWIDQVSVAQHAQADLGVAPGLALNENQPNERGPP
ncbi:hypothetical protein [Bremerella sp. P1]|uniref:hypothetical protein n=1 Tax=Bremerella sp. P1 TaxID=3026424 RepID=UPI00236763A8|nr:hypothetical protein [Bremerella sp. P1]WDI40712.1 hypothetical protein PSR63_19760 [Bremerella sp. P1]